MQCEWEERALNTQIGIGKGLGRLKQVDLRSLNYPIRPLLLGAEHQDPQPMKWALPIEPLDQGREGSCVGHGFAHDAAAEPVPVSGVDHRLAVDLYRYAQTVDEWPGEAYEGTSVLAGAKAAVAGGHCKEYRWCMNVDDVVATLGYEGPVVIGVDWYEGMGEPDRDGFVHPKGHIRGGHCVCLNEVYVNSSTPDPLLSWVAFPNSWGPDWGPYGGYAKITLVELAILFPGGDFCVLVDRCDPATATA